MTDELIISECPAAFAEFAEKHNALVNLINSMRGIGGVNVSAADANIIIDAQGLAARVAILEAMLAGFSEQTLDVCIEGVATETVFLSKTPPA